MSQLSGRRSSPAAPPPAQAASPEAPARWIMLIHSIPPRPNYLRVKIGRRLQKLGAGTLTLGGVNTFGLLLALAIVSWFFIHRFAPETKGRQLEAIHEYCENGGVWPEPADRGSRAA